MNPEKIKELKELTRLKIYSGFGNEEICLLAVDIEPVIIDFKDVDENTSAEVIARRLQTAIYSCANAIYFEFLRNFEIGVEKPDAEKNPD